MKHRLRLLGIGLLVAVMAAPPAPAQILHDLTDRPVALAPPRTTVAGKRATVLLTGPHIADAFNGVVVQGVTTATELLGWIRFDGAGPWHPLRVVRSTTDGGFVVGYRADVYRQDQHFELRFEVEAGASLRVYDAGVFDNRLDEDRRGHDDHTAGLAGKKTGHIIPPPLITRAEWGAAPFIRGNPVPLANPDYDYLTFHHAAGFRATTIEEGKAQVKAIQDLHQNIRGWSDIGYQFVIDRGGHLYQGRPFLDGSTTLEEVPRLALGAHVGGHNTGNIGVAILGCYHPPEGAFCTDVITPEAWDTYTTLFAFLSERYGVAPDLIRGHRDFSSTACPGDNNYPLLGGLRADVAGLLLTGNAPLGTATLAADADATGVVRLSWAFLENLGIDHFRIERVMDGRAEVVYAAGGAPSATFVDDAAPHPGPARYALYAANAAGRTQQLAAADVTIPDRDDFFLAGNFPNPFAGQTTIRYFLRHTGIVSIKVYDATGREVRSLVDRFQQRDRWYTAHFDATGLPAGSYFYRILVDGFAGVIFDRTHAMVVLR